MPDTGCRIEEGRSETCPAKSERRRRMEDVKSKSERAKGKNDFETVGIETWRRAESIVQSSILIITSPIIL